MTPPSPDRWDLWYGRGQRLLWTGLGTFGMLHQFVLAKEAQPILVAAAIVCLGLPISKFIDRRLDG